MIAAARARIEDNMSVVVGRIVKKMFNSKKIGRARISEPRKYFRISTGRSAAILPV